MYAIGEYVVYKHDVCMIDDIKEKHYRDMDYYVLKSVSDSSLTTFVPAGSDNKFMRPLLSRSEVDDLISRMPDIPLIDEADKMMEVRYKELLNSMDLEDLIRIIKTTYARNEDRVLHNKKVGDKDSQYFEKAERFLYTEFSVVLGLSFEETKEYVNSRVDLMVSK